MASIRRRKDKYQAQVRLNGVKICKTFNNLKDAKKWSIHQENKINLGTSLETLDKTLSLADLVNRYLKEITPFKKGHEREKQRLKRLLKESICKRKVSQLSTKDFVAYKNKRILDGNRTCRYDLALLHHIYNVAIKQWNYPIIYNPISNIPKPKCNPPRERRLSDNELKYILNEQFKNPNMVKIIELAIETGMRRSEILGINKNNYKDGIITLSDTKNGCSRKIPLTKKATEILDNSKLPFQISDNAFKLSWNRMLNKSGIKDLHFHDLRHEAISRLFEMGFSIPEVSLVSGHKDVRQLMKYTHLKIKEIKKKLTK